MGGRASQVVVALLTAVACICGLFLMIGAWALIASEGERDPQWSWTTYVITMLVTALIGATTGGGAWVLHQRANPGRSRRSS